jgi:two-component system, cell cycle sensor histidine kinase and response regulator CckA
MTAYDNRSNPHLNETQQLRQRIAELEASVERLVKKEERLQESCRRMDSIVNKLPDIVYRLDSSGNIEFINQAITAYGYSPDELKGAFVMDLVHPDDREKATFRINERRTGERSTRDFEVRLLTRDQKVIPLEVNSHCDGQYRFEITSEGVYHGNATTGKCFSGTQGVARNITRRKKIEAALQESEIKYRTLVERSNDGIDIVQEERLVYVNQRLAEMLGYTVEEMTGKHFTRYLHPNEIDRVSEYYSRRVSGKPSTSRYETVLLHRNGTPVDVEINAGLIDMGEKPTNLVFVRNIAHIKKTENALRESEQKYRMIIEHANEAIIIIQNGFTCLANPKVITVTGYSFEELSQINVAQLIHPEDRQETLLICDKAIQDDTLPLNYTFRLLHKTGKIFWMQANSVRIEWEGNPATLTLLRDISEQKKLEAQLLQAQKMEAIGNLAGGIAHDFNNILQAISGYAQILAMSKSDSDPEFRKLEMILRSTQRGSELIKRLLIFSRKLESKLMPLNINSEVHQVFNILERTIPKMIRIKLDLEEPIQPINADTVQIEQIMMNISVNARDAMPEGGEMTFSTRNVLLNDQFCNTHIGAHPGHYALLAISDTGVGIDSDTLTHIFEPFYTTKKTGNGTGLGLAMVYGIVKNHNGFIQCQSGKDRGTTFQIYFPVIEEERMHLQDNSMPETIPQGRGIPPQTI